MLDFVVDFNLILAIIIAFFSTLIQSLTGFGFAIISTPLLIMVYDPKEVVVILQVLSVILDTIFVFFVKDSIDWKFLKPLLLGSILGHPVGILIYLYIPTFWLKIFIASIILFFLLLTKLYKKKLQETTGKTAFVGFLSGVLNTSTSMSGPPLILYLTASMRDKSSLRATCIAYFTLINFLGVFAFFLAGKNFDFAISQSLYILPFCLIALWLGNKLFPYISQKLFNQIVFFMLIFAAIYTIYSTIY